MPLTDTQIKRAPIGTLFVVGNTTYTVTGHKPNRPKFTFTGSGPQGGLYKFTTDQVLNGLIATTSTSNNNDSRDKKRQKITMFDDVNTLFLAQDIYEIVSDYVNGASVDKSKLENSITKRVAERDYYVNRSTES